MVYALAESKPMTSEAQLIANRTNALASTGPVTDQGKSRASRNAAKTGLFSAGDFVLRDETQIHAEFCAAYQTDLAPVGPVEETFAAEITREKLYLRLHQELPYQSTVETEVWKELKDGSVRIEQTIYVARESQRKIVLGKGGQAIKAIGAAARADIAKEIEHPVHLFLHVKVREGWADDPERYREMGLEFPKE